MILLVNGHQISMRTVKMFAAKVDYEFNKKVLLNKTAARAFLVTARKTSCHWG
jgi:hypothetical protein